MQHLIFSMFFSMFLAFFSCIRAVFSSFLAAFSCFLAGFEVSAAIIAWAPSSPSGMRGERIGGALWEGSDDVQRWKAASSKSIQVLCTETANFEVVLSNFKAFKGVLRHFKGVLRVF